MKREQRIVAIAAVVIIAGAVAGIFLAPRLTPPAVLVPAVAGRDQPGGTDIRPQAAAERRWESAEFSLVRELGTAPGATMADPIAVRVDGNGAVYVLDWGARCVRKFSTAGDQVCVFGGRSGHGPGEFINLTDMDVSEDGAVWTCDPANGLVTVFAPDGSVRSTVRTGRPPHRVSLVGGGAFVVMPSPAGNHLFHRYNAQGMPVDTCGTIVRDQERMGVALDGRCAGSPDGRFVYAGYRAGIIGLLNVHTPRQPLFVHTVEHPGLPRVISQQVGDVQYIRVHPEAPMVSRSVSIVEGEVHIASGTLASDKKGIMDVYDHETGTYLRSYEIPAAGICAHRTQGMLYVVADTTVRIWAVKEPNHLLAEKP
jgi:hypothetical protein